MIMVSKFSIFPDKLRVNENDELREYECGSDYMKFLCLTLWLAGVCTDNDYDA